MTELSPCVATARAAAERTRAERRTLPYDFAARNRRAAAIAAQIARDEEEAKAAGDTQYLNIRKFTKGQMSRKAKLSAAAGGGGSGDDGGGLNAPLWKMWALLQPSWRSFLQGEAEAAGMLAICVVRIFEFRMQTGIVRALNATLSSRNVTDFKAGLLRSTAVALGGALLRIVYSYLQARLTWKWRVKLTTLLHEKYFAGNAFYLLGPGAKANSPDQMADPDTRISADLEESVNGFASCFSDAMFAATAGVIYTVEIGRLFGWRFAAAPYAYLGASYLLVEKLLPMRQVWRRRSRAKGQSFGRYLFAMQRLGLQAEAVATFQGGERECSIIEEEFMMHMWDCDNFYWGVWKFQILNRFLNHYLAGQFVAMVCIGRGAWWPKYEGGRVETIEQLAELRADVGVQWMLFNQCLSAARQAIEMVHTLQKLVGTVERVTELLELLVDVGAKSRGDNKANFVDDDAIAFEHVDIVTPGGVTLVKDLSFRLERGDSLLLVGQ